MLTSGLTLVVEGEQVHAAREQRNLDRVIGSDGGIGQLLKRVARRVTRLPGEALYPSRSAVLHHHHVGRRYVARRAGHGDQEKNGTSQRRPLDSPAGATSVALLAYHPRNHLHQRTDAGSRVLSAASEFDLSSNQFASRTFRNGTVGDADAVNANFIAAEDAVTDKLCCSL
ncbi:MAG: hypothetical protein QNK04_09760 [Myxococcota bacterium]|nr:hypothetical protein [Myxococcota bacterium]